MYTKELSSLLFIGFVWIGLISTVQGVTVEKELIITPKEKAALEKFKAIVWPQLKDDYMKEDLYLIRWLRATKLDLKAAEQRLVDNLKFREDNSMDTILKEDWSDMEYDYPYSVDTQDKEGRPIVSFTFGDWDIRKAVIQGNSNRVIRWLDRAFEEASVEIREKQRRGENVTQCIFLIDIGNFNLAQQGCLRCLPAIYQYFQHQGYYPYMADKIILVNTPYMFETVLRLIDPIMVPETRTALKVFGQDKQKWRNYLYSLIDKNQLYTEFGGTRTHY